MVGVCDGGQDRGRSEGSVTTREAQEGRTRRGEVRTVQERESRELELKLELPGQCQGREPGPGHMGRAGESRRWAWSPTRHRPSAMSSASASGLVGRDTHQRGDGQSGSSWAPKGGLGGVWEVGGSWQAGQCGLWRRIQWRPLASDVLASGLGPALHVPPPVLHFPDHLFRFQDAVLFQQKQAKDTTTAARPPHDGPYLSGQSFVPPDRRRVVGTGSHLATTMAVEASVPCGNCPVEAITFARDDDILVPRRRAD